MTKMNRSLGTCITRETAALSTSVCVRVCIGTRMMCITSSMERLSCELTEQTGS